MKQKILCIATVFLIVACSYHDIEDVYFEKETTKNISAEEAGQNVIHFVSAINRQTITRGSIPHTLEIASIIPITTLKSAKTRMQTNSETCKDTLFYVVKFAGENNGFALAASRRKDPPIYAYIENGEFNDFMETNDSTATPGFNNFLGALYEYTSTTNDPHEVDSSRFDKDGYVKSDETIVLKSPLLVTKWGQGYPYNLKCEENLAGCVPVALAQIWTHLGKLQSVSWEDGLNSGYSSLNWDAIRKFSQEYFGDKLTFVTKDNDTIQQIASLIRFMGCNSNATYGKNGTSANSEYAINEIKGLGVYVDGLKDFDAFDVVNHLRSNHVVFMSGYGRYYHVGLVFRKYVDGHAWVVDGFLDRYEAGNRYIYLHCNWGWNGYKNGYFYSKVLNAEEKPRYDDYGNKTRATSQNYRYNLKTAAIWD